MSADKKYTLYHFPLSPFSRKVRILLKEKDIPFELIKENFWEKRRDFLAMNPASQVPLLVSDEGEIYGDSSAICEFIEEIEGQPSLIGSTPNERASVRKIANWFNNKFYYEVTKYLLDEKVFKYLKRAGEPNTEIIRAGENNLSYQMDFIAYLLQQHKWLAGEYFSLADITAAAHLSCLDFLGDVPWKKYAEVKEWYALVKSRPSFRPLLTDTLAGFTPAAHYSDLDF